MKLEFKNNKEIKNYNTKRFSEFRRSFGNNSEEVELASIKLEYPIHINTKVRLNKDIEYYKSHNKLVTTPLIVRKLEDGFVLLAGWRYYHLAHQLGQDKVKVFVVDFANRTEMMKKIGCVKPLYCCKMEQLNIPAKFDCSFVKPDVLEIIKAYDYKYHAPMMPIIVDKNMTIKYGYEQYLYNRNMEKEYCEVLIEK